MALFDLFWASVRTEAVRDTFLDEFSVLTTDAERIKKVLELEAVNDLTIQPRFNGFTITDENLNSSKEPGELPSIPTVFGGPHKSLPYASALLNMAHSPSRGRHLIAVEDIPVGAVVIVEEPYSWALDKGALESRCSYCCRFLGKFWPCMECKQVIYCSSECREAAWTRFHSKECGILPYILESRELSRMAMVVYRTVATKIAAEAYNGKDLINEIEPELRPSYQDVYNQITHNAKRTPADLLRRAVSAVYLGKCLAPTVSPEELEDIMELLLHHLQSCSCNAYQISEHTIGAVENSQCEALEIGGAVYPTISLSNHSCCPNIIRHSHGRYAVVRAIRNIRKGEEVLDSYGPHFLVETRLERMQSLNFQYFFKCHCIACSEEWPRADVLEKIRSKYICFHCGKDIKKLSSTNNCPHCKAKLGYKKIARKVEELKYEFKSALDLILDGKPEECVKMCRDALNILQPLVKQPNADFVKWQQAMVQSWNLLGNTNRLHSEG